MELVENDIMNIRDVTDIGGLLRYFRDHLKLKERNPKWINDDYVKFMRLAQYFVERGSAGVLAYINPHGFIDNRLYSLSSLISRRKC